MSEAETRAPPSRGRSSVRGGRGGFGRGGPRGGRKPDHVNGAAQAPSISEPVVEDEGELGEMKKKYASELSMLKDMFPDWTDVDLVFALEETSGDITATVDHITQGSVSQFAEVKKPKDRARSKAPGEAATAGAADKPTRGGRGRGGLETARGRGGRGGERGRGGLRGGRGGHAGVNGSAKDTSAVSVPTTESSAWDTPAAAPETGGSSWDDSTAEPVASNTQEGQSGWANVVTAEATPAAASEGAKSSLLPEGGPKKSWASMFAKPPPAPKAVAQPLPPPAQLVASGDAAPAVPAHTEDAGEQDAIPEIAGPTADEPLEEDDSFVEVTNADLATDVESPASATAGQEADLTPSRVPLTEENVEHLPDVSHPPATFTAASTTGSFDPRNLTPLPGQQPPIGRPPLGGYALSAHRAAGATRSASFQRRVQEQQEAVVMPGHNAVDRAAVQFGSMGLSGESGLDVDEEREDAETRQAPQHSPPAMPKTALPPASQQAAPESNYSSALPASQQVAPSPPSQQAQQQPQDTGYPQQEQAQANQGYNQYGGYGQGMGQEPQSQQQQKQYDPFAHQTQQQSQYDRYNQQSQQSGHSGFGALSSAPTDQSSYYTAEAQRNAYPQWYGGSGGYGQLDSRGHSQQQEAGMNQQRTASGFGAGPNESGYGQAAQQQVSNGRSFQQSSQQDHGKLAASSIRSGSIAKAPGTSPLAQADAAARAYSASRAAQMSTARAAANSREKSQACISDTSLQQNQSRYGDATGSGNNTPNPQSQQQGPAGLQQQQQGMQSGAAQQQQPHQAQQHQQQPASYSGYPYGHPYYTSPYQTAYANQFGHSGQPQQQQQHGMYGGGYQNKQQGMYGQQQGYGSSYDQHSSSPASATGYGQQQQASMRSASGMGSGLGGHNGLDEYGRQSQQSGSHGTSGFGGMNDPFARSTSGFGGQQSAYGQQQQSLSGQDDALKPYNDSKSGPSPALGQPGRPGSAANSAGGSAAQHQAQPSPYSQYGNYPSQASQYGGLGNLGGQQGQQGGQHGQGQGQGGYGSTYGAGAFGQYNGNQYGRGGWGQGYGH